MYAAIKALEDLLFLRRLQARELGYDKDEDRKTAIIEDIASLERGLEALQILNANANRQKCPTIGDLPAKTAGGTDTRP
jgi:hypothetical protein